MQLKRLFPALIALILLVSAFPARAEEESPITERGANVLLVDQSQGDLPNVLSDDDAQLVEDLRTRKRVQMLTNISPDDQAVLVVLDEEIGFLNIQTGDFRAFDPETVFRRAAPAALAGAINWSWRDGRTLASLGVVVDQQNRRQIGLVSVDRETLRVTATLLPGFPRDAVPVRSSPNGNRVLMLREAEPEEEASAAALTPVTWQTTWSPPAAELADTQPAVIQRMTESMLQEFPELAVWKQWQSFYDSNRSTMTTTPKKVDILLYDLAARDVRTLTQLPISALIFTPAFTPDGSRLALSSLRAFDFDESVDPRNRRRYDGALLSEEIYRDVTGNLPPEQNPFFNDNIVQIFNLDDGTDTTLRAADGDGAMLFGASWSTDNQTLLTYAWYPGRPTGRTYPIYNLQFAQRLTFRFYDAQFQEVGRGHLEATELHGPGATGGEFISPDELMFAGISGTNRHLYFYNFRTGEYRNLATKAGTYTRDYWATRLSRQIVFEYTSFTEAPDLYRINWDGTALSRLTWTNEELSQLSKTSQYPVSFTLRNGQVRNGTLILPDDVPFPPKDQRIIVWQEGGPGGDQSNFWSTAVERPFALLPNFGFGVLVVPLAGREGNGPDVLEALYDGANFGQLDIDEQAEITRQMIARGWTARGKVGITGCSYGGYFVWQSIIRHPDLYAAANPQCALVDNIVEWNRGYASLMPYLEGVPPWVSPDEYRRDSPLYNVDRVKTPTLTFHGTDDFLPNTLNQNAHIQLVNRKVPARMLSFYDEGHGLGELDNQNYAAQEQILWFRTYLK